MWPKPAPLYTVTPCGRSMRAAHSKYSSTSCGKETEAGAGSARAERPSPASWQEGGGKAGSIRAQRERVLREHRRAAAGWRGVLHARYAHLRRQDGRVAQAVHPCRVCRLHQRARRTGVERGVRLGRLGRAKAQPAQQRKHAQRHGGRAEPALPRAAQRRVQEGVHRQLRAGGRGAAGVQVCKEAGPGRLQRRLQRRGGALRVQPPRLEQLCSAQARPLLLLLGGEAAGGRGARGPAECTGC